MLKKLQQQRKPANAKVIARQPFVYEGP